MIIVIFVENKNQSPDTQKNRAKLEYKTPQMILIIHKHHYI